MKNLLLFFSLFFCFELTVAQNINSLGKGLRARGYPYTISQDASGRIYVGGYIKGIGGVDMRSIAQLDNSIWKKLPGDPDAIWKTRTVGNDLYAVGLYATANGGVLHWDGFQWDTLGAGLVSGTNVQDLEWADNHLWMALGNGTLVKWENNAWQTSPSPANITPFGLKSLGDTLFAWGNSTASGYYDYALAFYFNGTWTNFPVIDPATYSLTTFNGKLIAGRSGAILEIQSGGNASVIGNFTSLVLDITEHNGELYAAIYDGAEKGIYQYAGNNSQWTNLNLPLNLYSNDNPWRVFSLHGNLLAMVYGKGMWRYANGQWEFLEGWRITDILSAGNDSYFFASFPSNIYQQGEIYKEINGVGGMVFEKPSVSVAHTGGALCPRRHIFWEPVTEGIFVKYRWSFPGASIDSSGKRLPVNYYAQSGAYSASLIAENLAGSDTIAIPPIVVQDGCIVPPGPKPDNVWLLNGSSYDENQFAPALDFYYDQPDSAGFYAPFSIANTNASICDDDGNLLFYTNGLDVANHRHEMIAGSEDFNKEGIYVDYEYDALYDNQGALILPYPEHPGQFYVFHMASSEFTITIDTGAMSYQQPLRLAYSIVDMNANNGSGK
jgi:hypothetical protein